MTLEEFIEQVTQRPLPQHPMTRVRVLAKELAEGAAAHLWRTYIYTFRREVADENVSVYLEKRWNNDYPALDLLEMNEYATWPEDLFTLKKAAFDLLDEAEPANIFISYKRSESSAFALLILARLKMAGLEPFLDMALVPGEDWLEGLKARIQSYDYLIAVIGKETLKSEVTLQEIAWAQEAGLTILPVWHNGFIYRSEDWPKLSLVTDKLLKNAHTIRVLEESAVGYNNAIVELMNRFGVTP